MARARSNQEWQRWGEIDPLYGVASWAGKRAESRDAWTDEDFYDLGESDWHDFRAAWRRYGVEPGTCVEIGCGAGRLTRPMADFFTHVHGIDVAAGMLDRARTATDGLPVTLHHSDGLTLPLRDASVDAVFCAHVFQHLDSEEDALANWREIARVLRPGGSLMVHLPIRMWPDGMEQVEVLYQVKRKLGDVRARWRRRQMRRGKAEPIMRGLSYLWSTLDATLSDLGLVDRELNVFRVRSNEGVHPFVFARKR